LRSLKAKLGQYKEIPPTGLALFCGAYTDPEGKERKLLAEVVPLRVLSHSIYKCDSRFHTELLRAQLADESRYGFIVIDGSCASFHLLVGDTKETIFKKEVSLPKKHGRGGQSQNRFARIREEKRDWYTTDIADLANKHFIDLETNKINVKGLIVSGSASLKVEMMKKLDPRVARAILHTYDIQYSGEAGFNQTLILCEADLADCRYTFERGLLGKYFTTIAGSDGLYTHSPADTIYALEAGAVETLIVWNELSIVRSVLAQPSTGVTRVVYHDNSRSLDLGEADAENSWQVQSSLPLLDWILEHYKEFGSELQIVSGSSTLGAQFCSGFGGVGALLRYPVEIPATLQGNESEEEEYEY